MFFSVFPGATACETVLFHYIVKAVKLRQRHPLHDSPDQAGYPVEADPALQEVFDRDFIGCVQYGRGVVADPHGFEGQ